MRIISSDEIDACLFDRDVIETLRHAYRSNLVAPHIQPPEIARPNTPAGIMSFQPAWTDFAAQGHVERGYVGCSISLAFDPHQPPSSSLYVLFSGKSGQPIGLLDGMRLRAWRSAGVHALAASYLSREDASRLLVIGNDIRIPRLISAYACVRNLTSVLLCGASSEVQKRLAQMPELKNISIGTTDNVPQALEGADMVSIIGPDAQTRPLVDFDTFDPPAGCHIDLVSLCDLPPVLLQEGRLFTSQLSSAPLKGAEWASDLHELAKGGKAGRRYYGQRTLFIPSEEMGLPDFAIATHIFLRT